MASGPENPGIRERLRRIPSVFIVRAAAVALTSTVALFGTAAKPVAAQRSKEDAAPVPALTAKPFSIIGNQVIQPGQPALSAEVTQGMVPVAAQILKDYSRAKPQFRQKESLAASAPFGRVASTQLTVVYPAHSTITGRESEYILQADYADPKAGINPANVVGVSVTVPSKAVPLTPVYLLSETPRSYIFSALQTNREPLAPEPDGKHWTVNAEYNIGPSPNLENKSKDYTGVGGTTGPSLEYSLRLTPPEYTALDTQLLDIMAKAQDHAAITRPENLASQFPGN